MVSRLRAGISILVFPEGTRSTNGELLKFRRGGFLLALKSGLPIVPAGILGSREAQSKKEFVIRPGEIWVHYGTPIETTDYSVSTRDELMAAVRGRMSELLTDE